MGNVKMVNMLTNVFVSFFKNKQTPLKYGQPSGVASVQSFECNYAVCKTEISLTRTTDTFKAVNGLLRSEYLKTEM